MTIRNTQRLLGLVIAIAWPSAWPSAADWPSYRHDNQRSGITAETLKLPLARRWQMIPAQPPSPAWAKPA